MVELANLIYKELDSLSLEEKINLLEKEFNMYQSNRTIQYEINDLNENTIIKLLESVMNAKSSFQITQGGEYPAKLVADIYKYSNFGESEFFDHLKILYLNDYIEYVKVEEFDIKEESPEVIYDNHSQFDTTLQLRFNLHRLYRTNRELFNEERYIGLESIGSEARMYYRFLDYGTIIDKICSYETLMRLSNKGMHYLHFFTSKRSIELMHKQEDMLEAVNEATTEQTRILDSFEQHKIEQDNNIESIHSLINNHSDKIKAFYKDITTILSIMVAAFAVIGVNLSAIPKIDSNFTANVLALNFSLILCLLVLFYILRVIVYDAPINNKHFYSIFSFAIIGIICVFIFLGFNNESKIDVIEKKYQKMLSNYTSKSEEEISIMKRQIEQLEKQKK
ncbi:hypothetical protein [Neobacillus sp.]|uniref:hypothetical protein n=1 Tax=Neobacillus sp. TaxID=2675273 RepID=UPI00289D7612|nr:hypothetical protein [Neobacillus sp.]